MKESILLKGIKQKNQKSFLKIIDIYSKYVYTVVRNVLGEVMQKEDIEETVSDVFVSLWQKSDNIDLEKPLKPYLVAIARNKAIDKLRTYKGHISLEQMEENQQEMPIYTYDMVSKAENKEKMEIVKGVLKESKPVDRDIFILYYYYYEKTRVIAEKCQVSESKVKTTLSRLRDKMKIELERNGYDG